MGESPPWSVWENVAKWPVQVPGPDSSVSVRHSPAQCLCLVPAVPRCCGVSGCFRADTQAPSLSLGAVGVSGCFHADTRLPA